MGLEFLARVRRSTLWLTAIVALIVATYQGVAGGVALLAGALGSLVNLMLLEQLVVAATAPNRASLSPMRRAGLTMAGMIALIPIGLWLLNVLPPLWLLGGFSVPFMVMVLKAASSALLESRAWKKLVASRWRAAAIVSVLVAASWWVGSAATNPEPQPAGSGTVAPGAAHAPELGASSEAASRGAEAQGAESHGGSEEGGLMFPNVITILGALFPNAGWVHFLHHYEVLVFSFFIAVLLSVLAIAASRRAKMIPGRFQNAVEMVVQALHDFVVGILGPTEGPRFVPFIGTLFLYILFMNLFGLIPLMHAPTSSLNVTAALGLTVFVYAQFIGLRRLGVIGYVDHLMGNPRSALGWGLVPLMLPVHVLGELAKPISLSCRLFGNVFGEDMLLAAFASLGITILAFTHLPIGLPLHVPFLFLALLTSFVQALIFTILTTIYFLLMMPHEEHGHEAEGQHAHP